MGRYADFYNNMADQFGFIVNGLSTIFLEKTHYSEYSTRWYGGETHESLTGTMEMLSL